MLDIKLKRSIAALAKTQKHRRSQADSQPRDLGVLFDADRAQQLELQTATDRAAPSPETEDLETAARRLALSQLEAKDLKFNAQKQRRIVEAYTFLLCMTLTQKERLEHKAGKKLPISAVTFRCPAEQIAAALENVCGKRAFDGYLSDLQEAGLIAYKGRSVSVEINGVVKPRCDTTVFCVALSASVTPKLTPLDFKNEDGSDPGKVLEERIAKFQTSYMWLKTKLAKTLKDLPMTKRVEILLDQKPLLPVEGKDPLPVSLQVSEFGLAGELRSLTDVPKEERSQRVDGAAQMVAAALNDQHSVNFYRRVLWQTYRAQDAGVGLQPDGSSSLFSGIAGLISQAVQAKQEGAADNPGKLANALVKRWVWWDEIERVPMRRVATRAQAVEA